MGIRLASASTGVGVEVGAELDNTKNHVHEGFLKLVIGLTLFFYTRNSLI